MKKKRAKKIVRKRTEKELKIELVADELNPKQKYFCQLYSFSKDFFGNATRAYMTAYNLPESRSKSARAAGHLLLTNINIKAYIRLLLEEKFKNSSVDIEIGKLIGQDKNLLAKLGGIQEYNKMMKRITNKVEIEFKPEPILGGSFAKQKVKV